MKYSQLVITVIYFVSEQPRERKPSKW